MFNYDDYDKPIEIKSAFNGNYVLYESNGDKNGLLSIYEYFNKIKPSLRDLIDFYNTKGEWKVQLSMHISFKILFNIIENQIMHSKSDNVEIMRGLDTNDVIDELIESFAKRYQEGLETKMKGRNYAFERAELLEYHFHKVSSRRGSSYVSSRRGSSYIAPSKRLLSKNSTLDPHNKDNRCFLYATVIALNHENISNNPQRIANLIEFIPQYNWDDINFPASYKEYSTFEKNNRDIVLNILFIEHNTQEIRQSYISKHNKTRIIHANLLMITNGRGKWHYLAIKSVSALLRGLTSTYHGDFYCLNCFHSYRTNEKLKKHEQLCQNHDFCNLKLLNQENKYISSTSGKSTLKIPFIIHADLECLLLKMDSCENTPKRSYSEKKALHVPSGFSILICYS